MIADRPAQAQRTMSAEAFDAFALLPENRDRRLEFIDGRVIELVSNNLSSEIAGLFITALGVYLRHNKIGRMTVPDGGYIVNGHRYIPDVGIVLKRDQPTRPSAAYNTARLAFVVEVLSPTNREEEILTKITNYLQTGSMVCVAHPYQKQIIVWQPNKTPITLTIEDTLDGGDVLPGFSVPVRELFPEDIDDALEEAE